MLVAIISFTVLACSGPRAMEAINSNFRKSVLLAFVAGVFVALAWTIYRQLKERISLLLGVFCSISFAVHPAWTVSAMAGDCGIGKLANSKFFTTSIGMIFTFQACWWLWKRKINSTTDPV